MLGGIIFPRKYVGDVAMPMFESSQWWDMGERKCAYDGCNALEFRTTGYCLRHNNGATLEKEKEESTHSQSTVNLQNNLEINNLSQIILGLISPFIITFSLLMLFPPCLFWCSDDAGGLTLPSLLICHSTFIFIGFASESSKYSIAYIISIIPSWMLAFGLWLSL